MTISLSVVCLFREDRPCVRTDNVNATHAALARPSVMLLFKRELRSEMLWISVRKQLARMIGSRMRSPPVTALTLGNREAAASETFPVTR